MYLREIGNIMKYIIVPDLHGETDALRAIIAEYPDDPFVFLGDVVDRGPSSHETFKLVRDKLRASSDSFALKSNHDNKFYRWLKKHTGLMTANGEFPEYGMKLAHGLAHTVEEFCGLSKPDQETYATDFIAFYEKADSWARIGSHYFAHAGLWENSMTAQPTETKKQRQAVEHACIYQSTESVEDLKIFSEMTLHVGHHVKEVGKIVTATDGEHTVVWHDVGLGKHTIDFDPVTMIASIDV